MKYLEDMRAFQRDPKSLEDLYHTAQRDNAADEFRADLLTCQAESPDNVLYAAWYYRLQTPAAAQPSGQAINWKLAIPLGLIAGLILAILTDSRLVLPGGKPYLGFLWAPISACLIVAFLTLTANQRRKQALSVVAGLVILGAYVTLIAVLTKREQYETLMLLHLPLMSLIGVGIYVVGLRSDPQNRFAFLIKTIETLITGGLYVMAGGVFAVITFGMFSALAIQAPVNVQQFLVAGGGGAITVLAVATVYDPRVSPTAQKFEEGLGKLISTAARLLLPLTLLVLVAYILVIPFNFMQPFLNRDVLIVYNAGLFAVMALLVGVTPVRESDLPQKYHAALRAGILAVAILAGLVSLYALSATVYRTALGGLTLNRVTVIGWNVINIGILILLIYRQLKHGPAAWVRSLQSAFSVGAVGYVAWTLFLTLATPWLFR